MGQQSMPGPSITMKEEGEEWTLRPDRQIKDTNIVVQLDGPYHRTKRQQQKHNWRDGAIIANGYRVLHIDTELLTVKRYWPFVKDEIAAFEMGKELVGHIYA
jgi:hypothetical protein